MKRPLNVLWRQPVLEKVLEGYFIKEVLLAGLGRPVRNIVVDGYAPLPILSDVLVAGIDVMLAGYLPQARAHGASNIGILHLADEHSTQDRSYYGQADYVLRHYFYDAALASAGRQSLGAIWVPNGYGVGVGPIAPTTLLPTAERTIMGFFSGSLEGRTLSDERKLMANVVRDAKLPFVVGGTQSFGKGLPPVIYSAYLCASRFGLVPGGNCPETIRLYEVLEAGAIPIMLKSAFVTASAALDGPPFILLNDWSELPAAYAPYADANNPSVIDAIETKRTQVYAWWTEFKALQQRRVRDLVDRSFARAHGIA